MPDAGTALLLGMQLQQETDCVRARGCAKQLAGLLGFDVADQTRIATAVSEIVRNAFEYAGGGKTEFLLDGDARALRVRVADRGKGIAQLDDIWAGVYRSPTGMGVGLTGARRLMDAMTIETGASGTTIELTKALPASAELPGLGEIARKLTVLHEADPTVETSALYDQNRELLTVLSQLRAREAELKERETELRTLNAELEETNRGVMVLYAEIADKAQAVQLASEMKTRFLSGVTHELRTPLNSIVSLSRLLMAHTDGALNAEQEKQVSFILRSAQNLTELVNDLLDLAKIEAGKVVTNLTIFTVAELLQGLRGMFRPLATSDEVELRFDIPDEPLTLRSDEGKVAQILRNFISNALKFTAAGSVVVSAQPLADDPEGRRIRFSVADTGVGIAPEHRELVMQEWGQVQHAHSRGKGSGLGLPLSRSLAEMLGGEVSFTSEPGVGSTFSVVLPALHHAPAETHEAMPEHILMVDDDEVARYLLRRMLGGLTAATVEEAKDGAEALAAIARRRPRLVFLDLAMPGMSGLEVARVLRAQPHAETLPIVLYTGSQLSPAELALAGQLHLEVVRKSGEGLSATEGVRMQVERALLQVGLSNLHHEPGR